jgi:hypothetical protein
LALRVFQAVCEPRAESHDPGHTGRRAKAVGSEVSAARCPMIGGPITKPAQPNAETVATAVPGAFRAAGRRH